MPNANSVFQAAGRDSTVTFSMVMAQEAISEMHFGESATWGFRIQTCLSAYCQQLFVETTNLAGAIHKVNLQNPVPLVSIFADATHAHRIVRMHVQRNLVSRNSLVWEMPDQMSRDRSAVFPSVFRGEFVRVTIELVRFDVGMRLEVLLAVRKTLFDVVAQLQFHRVRTHNERPAEIRFPFLKH